LFFKLKNSFLIFDLSIKIKRKGSKSKFMCWSI
jgi:hypothetical protein